MHHLDLRTSLLIFYAVSYVMHHVLLTEEVCTNFFATNFLCFETRVLFDPIYSITHYLVIEFWDEHLRGRTLPTTSIHHSCNIFRATSPSITRKSAPQMTPCDPRTNLGEKRTCSISSRLPVPWRNKSIILYLFIFNVSLNLFQIMISQRRLLIYFGMHCKIKRI